MMGAGPGGLFSFFLSCRGDDGAAPAALLVSSTPAVLQLHREGGAGGGAGAGPGLSSRPRPGPAAHQ